MDVKLNDEDVCKWRDLFFQSGCLSEGSEQDPITVLLNAIIKDEGLTKIIATHFSDNGQAEGRVPSIVRPPIPVTKTIARVSIDGRSVRVEFAEKVTGFNELVKSLGYSWKRPFFERFIRGGTISLMDAAAELCHRLLAGGFCFIAPSEDISQMAISGNYRKDPHRWVFRRSMGQYKDWFALHWNERNDDLYQMARRITVNRWDSPFVVVPLEHYQEVRDFAGNYGFGLTGGAITLMTIAETMEAESLELAPLPIQLLPKVSQERPLLVPVIAEVAYELADDDEPV